ncbi:hypothetical protein JCM9533A_31200 [Catenuloplanes niger JCM 9533]
MARARPAVDRSPGDPGAADRVSSQLMIAVRPWHLLLLLLCLGGTAALAAAAVALSRRR